MLNAVSIKHLDEKFSLSSEGSLTEAPRKEEGPDLVPTTENLSDVKGREDGLNKQISNEEILLRGEGE